MKRVIALILTLILLIPAAALGEKYNPANITDARRAALEVFRSCAFQSGEKTRDGLIRWDEPIRVYAAGKPSKKDLSELDAFILELQLRVPGLPSVTRVTTEEEANLVISYSKSKELSEQYPAYGGSDSFYSVSYRGGSIQKAVVGIATNKNNQKSKNHMMRENMVAALGLTGSQTRFTNSIVYHDRKDRSNNTQSLSELDWLMLNFLYSPAVSPGDAWDEVQRKLSDAYGF